MSKNTNVEVKNKETKAENEVITMVPAESKEGFFTKAAITATKPVIAMGKLADKAANKIMEHKYIALGVAVGVAATCYKLLNEEEDSAVDEITEDFVE